MTVIHDTHSTVLTRKDGRAREGSDVLETQVSQMLQDDFPLIFGRRSKYDSHSKYSCSNVKYFRKINVNTA